MREILFIVLVLIVPSAAGCGNMVCSSKGCECLDATENVNQTHEICGSSIYYTYDGNITSELYIGGYIFFPRAIADKIKVSGGVVEAAENCGWSIKVTQSVVIVQFIKLSDVDFSYATMNFNAKEYPKELFRPVEPDEMRMRIIELNQTISKLEGELKSVKFDIKMLASKPTFGEEVKGFLLYFPPLWIVYTALGVIGFLSVLGWWYARD